MKKAVKRKQNSASLNKEIAEMLKEAEIWKEKYYSLLGKHAVHLNDRCEREIKVGKKNQVSASPIP